jgi:nitrous oxidase accessory protein NosD
MISLILILLLFSNVSGNINLLVKNPSAIVSLEYNLQSIVNNTDNLLFYTGIITLNSSVTISDSIHIAGRNTEIDLNGNNLIINGDNIILDSLIITNGNLLIQGASNIKLVNLKLKYMNDISIIDSHLIRITSTDIYNIQTVIFMDSKYIIINNCIFKDIEDSIKILSVEVLDMSDNHFIGNIIDGISVIKSCNILIFDNILTNILDTGIVLIDSSSVQIKNIIFQNIGVECIKLQNSTQNIIMNNVCNSYSGITIVNNSVNNIISSNMFNIESIGISDNEVTKLTTTNKYSLNIFSMVHMNYKFKIIDNIVKNIIYISPFNNNNDGDFHCDGINDKQILQDALYYYNNTFGEVRLLAGVFNVYGILTIPHNIILSGMGLDITYLQVSGIYMGNNTNVVSMTLNNMTYGLMVHHVDNIYINNVHILGNQIGIDMRDSSRVRLFRCMIEDTVYSLYMDNITDFDIFSNIFYNCEYGININNINGGVISGNIINDNNYGLIINNIYDNSSLLVINNIIENLDNIGIDLYNVQNLLFSHNQMINVEDCISMVDSSHNLITSNICVSHTGIHININSYNNLFSENSIKLLEDGWGIINLYETKLNSTNIIVDNMYTGLITCKIKYREILLVNNYLILLENILQLLEDRWSIIDLYKTKLNNTTKIVENIYIEFITCNTDVILSPTNNYLILLENIVQLLEDGAGILNLYETKLNIINEIVDNKNGYISINNYLILLENIVKLLEDGWHTLNLYETKYNIINGIVDNIYINSTTCKITYDEIPLPINNYLILLENIVLHVSDNNYNILETFYNIVTPNISDVINATTSKLNNGIQISISIDISNIEYYPTKFEYTQLNNHNGIIMTIPEPDNGWIVGNNIITFEVPDDKYVDLEVTDWKTMDRLQIYRSGNNNLHTYEFIYFNYIRILY